MKKIFLVLALSCIPFLLSSDTSAEERIEKKKFYFNQDSYYILRAKAAKEGTPLLVWVKSIPRKFPGFVHFETDEDKWFGVTGPNLVVGVPYKGDLYSAVMPYSSTKAEIDSVIKKNVDELSNRKISDILGIQSSSQLLNSTECRT